MVRQETSTFQGIKNPDNVHPVTNASGKTKWVRKEPSLFDGHGDNEGGSKDTRLKSQLERVYHALANGTGWTLEDLSLSVDAPTSSVSARIRDLRKPRFGEHRIDKIHNGGGIYVYWMVGEVRPLLDGSGPRSRKAYARDRITAFLDEWDAVHHDSFPISHSGVSKALWAQDLRLLLK